MTFLPETDPDQDGPGPDSAAPKTLFGAALLRVGRFADFARANSANDLIFHRAGADGAPVQLIGADLAMMMRAAVAWGELAPILESGLAQGSRAALERIGDVVGRYRAMEMRTRPQVLSSIDGAQLTVDDVDHVAFLLDFIDTVAQRNPVMIERPEPWPFVDGVINAFRMIHAELPDGDIDVYVKRAREIWPEITMAGVVAGITALASHDTLVYTGRQEENAQ